MAGILDYSSQNPWVGDTLSTIGQGLLAYGLNNPQMMAQIPVLLQQKQQYRQNSARQQKLDAQNEQLFKLRLEEAERTANKDKAAKDAFQGLLTPSYDPRMRPDLRPKGLLGELPEDQATYIQTLGQADPNAALSLLGERLFQEPTKPSSEVAQIQSDLANGFITPEQAQAAIQKATYIAPQQPREEQLLSVWDGTKMVYLPKSQAAGMQASAPEQPENPLGNSFDANAINLLVTGDPSDPLYAATYAQMSQPKVQYNPATGETVTIRPNMSVFRAPGAPGSGAQPQPTGYPQKQGAFTPQQATEQGQMTAPSPSGVQVEQTTIPGLDKTAKAKITDARVDAESIIKAVDDYAAAFETAGKGERALALTGAGTELNSKYNTAALLSKAESLFNLGVLNGPDLDIIRRTLTDPSTMAGVITSPDAIKSQAKVIKDLVKQRLNAREREYGLPLTEFSETPTATKNPAEMTDEELLKALE